MQIVGVILLVLFLMFGMYLLVLFTRHIILFDSVPCCNCDSHMQFKGEKYVDGEAIYVFQCPKCSAIREIPAKELDILWDYPNELDMF